MKITGLITEYNPFHLGHEFHINSSKQKTNCDYTICIMSGNFVQRGIPAIVDKWSRTKMALLGGVDLVLELPTIYSVSSAEYFAFGAISTLNSLNIVDNICFGSECGDVTTLKKIAEILVNEPLEFKKDLKEQLNLGLSFPKARSIAIEKYIKNLIKNKIEIKSFIDSFLSKKEFRIILTGAGTSAFAGEVCEPYLTSLLNKRVEAIATTDLVASPKSYFIKGMPTLLISFARSGNSPESVHAVNLASQLVGDLYQVVITCNENGKLAKNTVNDEKSLLLLMPPQTNDLGFAMTSSFTTMVLNAMAVFNIDNIEHILNSPNNILAIEYCKSLFKLKSNINPITITRQGSGYNDNNLNQDNFSSASSIRKAITEKSLESCINVLPKYAYEILKNSKISDVDRMFFYVKYKLLSNPQFLSNIPDANEGLWNKILNNIGNFNNFDEFIMSCKSKRYSYTRISRVLCQCFLSLSKEDILLSKSKPQYIRVLGLNKNGAKILKEIKKNSKIKIVNKISSKNTDPMLSIDIKATNLYSLLNNNIMHNADFKISPIILK